MNQTQALKKAQAILGTKKVAFRVNPKALTGDELAQAREDSKAANERLRVAAEARKARHEALLAGDPEYQRLKAAHNAAQEARDKANSLAYHRRVMVLRVGDVFHVQEAEGDNFDEAISELARKKGRTA